ncbi:MAG: DoxX family protein [Bdellovibrionales bacterium]|nr:DoxX family protein [Bdellovibrionales bacterium]
MEIASLALQVTIAASIWLVWVLRHDNIVTEFQHFGFSNLFRDFIGAIKISLAALLIAGIWFPALIPLSALFMAFLMVCAQYTNFRVKNPISKFIPSFALLSLSLCLFALQTGRA